MLDNMSCPAPSRGTPQVLRSGKAQLFVNGEHTAANDATRQIALQLLEEIGVLEDISHLAAPKKTAHKSNRRTAEKVEKSICFMASFLRVAVAVDRFGILMDRHRWTDTPCGYQAARTVTKALLDAELIVKVVAPRKGQSTVFGCSEAFRQRLEDLKGELLLKRAKPHPIEVREPKKDYLGSFKKKRLPLDRFPSGELRKHRDAVIRLNQHLAGHILVSAQGQILDTSLRRIFTGDLRNGGRLYADYQNLPEADRLDCTIDGEPVCEIDLKASHVAILAALYQYPERLPQDPYAAIDWVKTPLCRKAAKTLVQCSIHADGGRPSRFPCQTKGMPFRDKYGLKNKKVKDLLPGILEAMPFLDGSPCMTLPLQFIEAEILVDALERLRINRIAVYPIHDSLLVKQSDQEEALRILQKTLRTHLGPHATWLDLSIAGQAPRLVEPLPCEMDEDYLLRGELEAVTRTSLEYAEEAEVVDLEDVRGLGHHNVE